MLNSLYERYSDINFVSVYITEAHADDEWPIRTKKELKIKQHTTINQRIKSALFMQKYINWKIPLYVDSMDNAFRDRYKSWPLRIFIVHKSGKLIWMMHPEPDNGLFDFKKIEHEITKILIQLNDKNRNKTDTCIIQ